MMPLETQDVIARRGEICHMKIVLQFAILLSMALTTAGSAQGPPGDSTQCASVIGTLAVAEPEPAQATTLKKYGLDSPTSLLRLMAQTSKCFEIVERGAGLQSLMKERELAANGSLQAGSNVGSGQMKA